MKKKRFNPFKNLKLDPYEQEIEDAIEPGEYKEVGDLKEEKKRFAAYARNTLAQMKKDKRVNIRVNKQDLERIQAKAADNGLRYQTLISTILHHFAEGKIRIEL